MQPDLFSLAARVGALTGPDREVDAEVARAFGWRYVPPADRPHSWYGWRSSTGRWEIAPPDCAASVDAVLALIARELPGWSWLMAFNGEAAVCDVHTRPIGVVGAWPAHAKAATPALALLSAALRAKAAQQQMEADR